MYIAVDIGGTNTRLVGATDLKDIRFSGEPVRRRNSTSYEDDIAFIIESAKQIADGTIDAIGIGLVGELSEDKTTSLHSKNNGHWNGKAFARDISAQLGCPVYADNDGVAAALGEAYYGSVESDFAYIIWGTGIGGALVTYDPTHRPSANILNWQHYFREWEYACGGSELAKTYNNPPEDFTAAEWATILDQFMQFVSSFVDAAHPQAVVFGGGLSVRHKQELEKLTERAPALCRVTSFGGDGGLYGGFGVIRNGLKS